MWVNREEMEFILFCLFASDAHLSSLEVREWHFTDPFIYKFKAGFRRSEASWSHIPVFQGSHSATAQSAGITKES